MGIGRYTCRSLENTCICAVCIRSGVGICNPYEKGMIFIATLLKKKMLQMRF